MGNLSDTIRKAVATVNAVTLTLQATVQHASFTGTSTREGNPNVGAPVTRQAIVQKKQNLKVAPDGSDQMTKTKLTFLVPVAVNLLDKITLPDGTSPRILAIEGQLDSDGNCFTTTVWF